MLMIYCSGRIWIEINKEKRHMRQNPEETWSSCHVSFPRGITGTCLIFQQQYLITHAKSCQPRKLTRAFVSRVFVFVFWQRGQSCRHIASDWPHYSVYVTSPLTTKKAFIIKHTINITYLIKMVLCGPRCLEHKSFFFFFAIPVLCRSSWATYWTCAIAATWDITVTILDPLTGRPPEFLEALSYGRKFQGLRVIF